MGISSMNLEKTAKDRGKKLTVGKMGEGECDVDSPNGVHKVGRLS